MSYDSVLIQIQKGAISPVYMLYGKEDYLKKELLKALQGKLGLTDNNNLSLDNIDARETTGASIVEKAETFPFLSEKRLVIVHGIDANPKLEAGTALASYLSSPSPFTCLVFTAREVDKRKKLFRLIHEKFVTLAIAPLKGAQAKGWLLTELKEKHAKMTKEAVETLIDLAGTDLFRLQMELEKLSLFAKGREITTSDVLEMISDNAGESAFEMADAMGRGEAGTALYTLNKLLLAGEAPLKIFGLIVRQLRIILFTRTLLKKGIPPKNIPAKAGFQPFLLSKYTKMSAGFDYETFKEMFSKLPETDKYLKSGFSQKMILEKLILDFCTLPKSRN